MAKTIAAAQANYARKTANAGPAYNASKGRATGNWTRGMTEFLGVAPSGRRQANYTAGINAAQYRAGDPQKWADNLRASMQE